MGQMIGIDFGKTNCRMARLKPPYDVEIIVNRDQLDVMPTMLVAQPDGEILVGRAAAATGLTHPERIVPELTSALESGDPVQISGGAKPPEDVLAHFFRRLKSDAEMRCGETVSGAVVAFPTMWNDTARETLRRAGERAGIGITPIASVIAAAIGACLPRPSPQYRRILVYDLGASDFTAGLLTLEDKRLTLVKTTELRGVGGAAFDQQIVEYVTVLVQRQHKVDPLASTRFMTKLRKQATEAKITLSTGRSADLIVEGVLDGGAVDVDLGLLLEDFERLIEDLVRETLTACQHLLDAAGWKAGEIDLVIPVGASTAVPLVREMLAETFGAGKLSAGEAKTCVALGAALHSGPLAVEVQTESPVPEAVLEVSASSLESEPKISEDEIPTTPPEIAEDIPAVSETDDNAPAGAAPDEGEAVSPQQFEESMPSSTEVQTAETGPAVATVAEGSAAAVQLGWKVVDVSSPRYDFNQSRRVRIEGAVFHLSTPRSAYEPVLDQTRVYLADPVPDNLSFVLTLDSLREAYAVSLRVPPGTMPGTAVEVRFCADLGTRIPYITAIFEGPADQPPVGVSANQWAAWEPMPPEPPAMVAAVVVPEPVPEPEKPAAPQTPVAEPTVPRTSAFGLYEVLEPLDSGSNYRTFRSRHPVSGVPAILCLYTSQDERATSAFLSSLLPLHVDHPNVVRLIDFGTAEGGYFVVTEYQGGDSLRTLMGTSRERQPVPAEVLVPFAVQVCRGLQALHERHIFHRNLKPSNIWLDGDRTTVKIADFHIAVPLRSGDVISQISGTLPYMAKEVLEGHADHRADLYAVGVIMFELLTGKLPFWANSQRQLVDQITGQTAAGPRFVNPSISEHLNEVVLRALEKDVSRRFQTAEEFEKALLAEQEPTDRLLETVMSQPPARGVAR